MNKNLEFLCQEIFGAKRFEIFNILCQRVDENGFVFCKIEELSKEFNISKPTIISAFKFLEEKKLLKKLKNGLYELKLGENNENKKSS